MVMLIFIISLSFLPTIQNSQTSHLLKCWLNLSKYSDLYKVVFFNKQIDYSPAFLCSASLAITLKKQGWKSNCFRRNSKGFQVQTNDFMPETKKNGRSLNYNAYMSLLNSRRTHRIYLFPIKSINTVEFLLKTVITPDKVALVYHDNCHTQSRHRWHWLCPWLVER